MTPSDDVVWTRWQEVDRLFAESLELPAEKRRDFVATAAGNDIELRDAVLSLVEEAAGADDEPLISHARLLRAWSESSGSTRDSRGLRPGDVVGRYRVVEEIGRGGMATVFEAERADGVFRQTVALKVLRRGLDTEEVVRRFRAERTILSELAHPHIASILDGGTTPDGRPFLVMRHVSGVPITRWAGDRNLDLASRVELFLQVADAVAFAHRRLVVHRDIKPSNVLVDEEGHATLLDFGIAKLLDPVERGYGAPVTRTGALPFTPEYASPEQIRGERVTTVSDVFQLGALLYQLLTGARPSDVRGREHGGRPVPDLPALQRTLTDSGPRASVALCRDLDVIVRKALRTEPDLRYGSVEAMADDLRRSVAGLPIRARRPSAAYRMRKFMRRHPWFPPVAAILLVAVAGYVATLQIQSRRLEQERNLAREHAERAEQLRSITTSLFEAADPYLAPDPARSRSITVLEALELGAARARVELADRPALRADILASIGGVYESLDLREPAVELLEEALAVRRAAGGGRLPAQADDLGALAEILTRAGELDSARVVQHRQLELARATGSERAVGRGLLGLGAIAAREGDMAAALERRVEAVQVLRTAGSDAHEDLAGALSALSDSYRAHDRLDEAESAVREGLDLVRSRYGEGPRTASAEVHLAKLLHARGDLNAALSRYRSAIPTFEASLGPLHFNTINTLNNFGLVLMDAGRLAEAEKVQRDVLDRRLRVPGGDSLAVATSLQNLAATVLRRGRADEADTLAARAGAMYRRLLPPGHHLPAFTDLTRVEIRLALGDGPGAEGLARRAEEILAEALPDGHYATEVARCRLGRALLLQGRVSEAGPLIVNALATLEASPQALGYLLEECRAVARELRSAEGDGSDL